jgi:hypothetical protein
MRSNCRAALEMQVHVPVHAISLDPSCPDVLLVTGIVPPLELLAPHALTRLIATREPAMRAIPETLLIRFSFVPFSRDL